MLSRPRFKLSAESARTNTPLTNIVGVLVRALSAESFKNAVEKALKISSKFKVQSWNWTFNLELWTLNPNVCVFILYFSFFFYRWLATRNRRVQIWTQPSIKQILIRLKRLQTCLFILTKSLILLNTTRKHLPKVCFSQRFLYESTGEKGKSDLRKVELESGKIVQQFKLSPSSFGEGTTILNGKIYQLTYEEGKAFVYDNWILSVV